MNRNIIIFGCDNAGKTTLAEQIVNTYIQWGYESKYQHSLGKDATPDEMHDFMRLNLMDECITVFDRFPIIEEEVCGKVLRGKNVFDGYYGESDAMLSKIDLFIFCMPHIFDIFNWGEREQMQGIKDNALELIHGYERVAIKLKLSGCNITQYSWRDDTATRGELNRLLREVVK